MRWAVFALTFSLVAVGATAFAAQPDYMTASWRPDVQESQAISPAGESPAAVADDFQVPHIGVTEEPYEWVDKVYDVGCKVACCRPCVSVFAEYLYLTPRDAEIAYALPIDGPIAAGDPRIPIGPTAMIDPEYDSGFKVGVNVPIDCAHSVEAAYTWYNSDVRTADTISAPDVLSPLVIHPSTFNAATDVLNASAHLAINYQLGDIDYKTVWYEHACCRVQALVGVRYAHLDQLFTSQFDFNGTTDVTSEVNFDGGGIRFGLDAEKHCCCGFLLYARGVANFLAGDFQGRYFQGDSFDPVVVDMTWSASRVVTVLEVELGVGWQSCDRRWRLTAGYVFNGWLNAVQPDEMIRAGQENDFGGVGDGLSFDGLVARLQYNF